MGFDFKDGSSKSVLHASGKEHFNARDTNSEHLSAKPSTKTTALHRPTRSLLVHKVESKFGTFQVTPPLRSDSVVRSYDGRIFYQEMRWSQIEQLRSSVPEGDLIIVRSILCDRNLGQEYFLGPSRKSNHLSAHRFDLFKKIRIYNPSGILDPYHIGVVVEENTGRILSLQERIERLFPELDPRLSKIDAIAQWIKIKLYEKQKDLCLRQIELLEFEGELFYKRLLSSKANSEQWWRFQIGKLHSQLDKLSMNNEKRNRLKALSSSITPLLTHGMKLIQEEAQSRGYSSMREKIRHTKETCLVHLHQVIPKITIIRSALQKHPDTIGVLPFLVLTERNLKDSALSGIASLSPESAADMIKQIFHHTYEEHSELVDQRLNLMAESSLIVSPEFSEALRND